MSINGEFLRAVEVRSDPVEDSGNEAGDQMDVTESQENGATEILVNKNTSSLWTTKVIPVDTIIGLIDKVGF